MGCICREDFEGDDCNTPRKSTIIGENTENTTTIIVVSAVSIILLLILLSVTVFAIIYYRRRIRNLRTASVQVEYHKENPGYGRNLNPIVFNTSKQSNPTNVEHRNNNTYSTMTTRDKILIPVKINSLRPLVDVDDDHLYEEIELKRNDYDHLKHSSINPVIPHYLAVRVERNNFAMCQVESPVDNELQEFGPFDGSLLD